MLTLLLSFKKTSTSPSDKDFHLFFLFLGILIQAKIPLLESLKILSQQRFSKKLQHFLQKAQEILLEGRCLHEAFLDPKIRMRLEASHISGTLTQTLLSLSHEFELLLHAKSAFKKMLTYPILVFSCLLFIVFAIGEWFIPSVLPLFEVPPKNLQLFIKISQKLPYFLIILVSTGLFLRKISLSIIPVIGPLCLKHWRMVFFLTLYPMVEEKIPVSKALAVQGISVPLDLGISHGLLRLKKLSPLSLQLIQMGEETGNLGVMLKTAYLFEKENFESFMNACLFWVGPMMTFFMAGILLWIILGVMFPLYEQFSV